MKKVCSIEFATKTKFENSYCAININMFGIFATTLVMLHDMKPRNDEEKQKLVRQVALGKSLFIEIMATSS